MHGHEVRRINREVGLGMEMAYVDIRGQLRQHVLRRVDGDDIREGRVGPSLDDEGELVSHFDEFKAEGPNHTLGAPV